jgi:pyruvate/2-oxoglutarate dehydrogenase complex dihydrolipoamide acyltransferase (E2) component
MSMTEGELIEWLVPDGSHVQEGQEIYLLATDKVETVVEAPANGVIRHSASAGSVYEVGIVIGAIEAQEAP